MKFQLIILEIKFLGVFSLHVPDRVLKNALFSKREM